MYGPSVAPAGTDPRDRRPRVHTAASAPTYTARDAKRPAAHLRRAKMRVVVHGGVFVDVQHVEIGDAHMAADFRPSPNLGAHHMEKQAVGVIVEAEEAVPGDAHRLIRQPPSKVILSPQRVVTGFELAEDHPLERHRQSGKITVEMSAVMSSAAENAHSRRW